MTVDGVVTAEAGRIGLPPQVAIQDATGAIVVKLPDGAPRPARGSAGPRDREARRALRSARDSASRRATCRSRGSGTLPDPQPGSAASLGEATEARLVVLEGTLDAAPVRETSGDLVLRLVDDAGVPFRARATRAAAIEPDRRADRLPAAAHGDRRPASLPQGRARRVPAVASRCGRPGHHRPAHARPSRPPRGDFVGRLDPVDRGRPPSRRGIGSNRGGRDGPGNAPRRLGPPPGRPGRHRGRRGPAAGRHGGPAPGDPRADRRRDRHRLRGSPHPRRRRARPRRRDDPGAAPASPRAGIRRRG